MVSVFHKTYLSWAKEIKESSTYKKKLPANSFISNMVEENEERKESNYTKPL